MRFLVPLLIGNSLVVGGVWFYHHFILPEETFLRIGFRLIVFGAVAIPCLWWWQRHRSVISLPLGVLAVIGSSLAVGLFAAQTYIFPALFPAVVRYTPTTELLAGSIHYAQLLALLLGGYLLFSLALLLMGKQLLRWLPSGPLENVPAPLRVFVIGAIGGLGWIGLIHVLDWVGWLSPIALQATFGLLILAEWRLITTLLRRTHSLAVRVLWPGWLAAFAILLLVFLIVLQLGDSLRPAPTGYDDMTHYLNQVRLMTERAEINVTQWPAAFEILLVGFGLALPGEGQFFPLSLGSYGVLIATVLVFFLGRHLFTWQTGVVAAVLFLSLPMTGALSVIETKPDSFLIALLLMALWTSLIAWEERTHRLLLVVAFLFGLAATVKLTALLFAPAFALFTIWLLLELRPNWRRIGVLMLGMLACFSIAWMPWVLHTVFAQIEHQAHTPHPRTLQAEVNQLTATLSCQATGSAEDFARFETPHQTDWLSTALLSWDITMNTTVRAFATEVGCLFLIFIPWLLVSLRSARQTPDDYSPRERSVLALLALLVLTTLLSWGLTGQGIPWYFFPVLAPLSLMVAWLVCQDGRSHYLALFLCGVFVAALISQTVVRMKFSLLDAQIRYGVGEATVTEYIDTALPGFAKVREYANADPNARMLVTGSRAWYGINNNDQRAVMDQHLDILGCLLRELGPEATARKLRALDIRYILFSKDQVRLMRLNTRPSFTAKVRAFTEFSADYLRPVWGSDSHLLFELAPTKNRR